MRLWQCLSRVPVAILAAASLMVVSSASLGQSTGWQSSGPGAGGRIALVIGNSAYADAPLRNPATDARLMSDTLGRLGFEVIVETDADQKTMKRAIQAFGEQLDASGPDGIGLFYYAGHGVQAAGTNYLIPVGALIGREADLKGQRDAQFHLGAMCLEGRGVRRDLRKARFWIAAAAKRGQPDAVKLVDRFR